jgi:hypothetical protein
VPHQGERIVRIASLQAGDICCKHTLLHHHRRLGRQIDGDETPTLVGRTAKPHNLPAPEGKHACIGPARRLELTRHARFAPGIAGPQITLKQNHGLRIQGTADRDQKQRQNGHDQTLQGSIHA